MKLDITGVAKIFGGLQALHDVTFSVRQDELLGVIGPNGAGKTTLFNVITGFVNPERGQVLLNDVELIGKAPHNVARMGIARTFQIPKPFSDLTVFENVMVPMLARGETLASARREVRNILELLGLDVWSEQRARTLNLSGRKRLEMARALATRPNFLLLDEVMGGLRPREMEEFIELIRLVHKQGVGLIIIEHIMAAVMELSQRILVLDQGQVIATGSPEEVARNPRVIQAYLGEEYVHAGTGRS